MFCYAANEKDNGYITINDILDSIAKRISGSFNNVDAVDFGIDANSTNSYIVFCQNGNPKYMIAFSESGIQYKKYENGNWTAMWTK